MAAADRTSTEQRDKGSLLHSSPFSLLIISSASPIFASRFPPTGNIEAVKGLRTQSPAAANRISLKLNTTRDAKIEENFLHSRAFNRQLPFLSLPVHKFFAGCLITPNSAASPSDRKFRRSIDPTRKFAINREMRHRRQINETRPVESRS